MDATSIQTLSSLVQAFWPIVYAGGGIIFLLVLWCVRLEARVLYNEKDLTATKAANKEATAAVTLGLSTLQNTVNSILQAFGRLEGRMEQRQSSDR